MRVEQVTFSRFLAAVSIVVFHYGREVYPFNHESVSFLFQQASIGVSYFFILSGFVMIIAYGNKGKIDTFNYLKSRFARIYPVYLLAILVLVGYEIRTNTLKDFTGVALNLFAVQAWVPGKALSFNYPGWSLAVEFFFYATFPFLFNLIYSRKGYKALILPVSLIWLITQGILHWFFYVDPYKTPSSIVSEFALYFPLMHLNEFLVGNLAGLVFINKLKGMNRNYDALILLGIGLVVVLLKTPLGLIHHNGMLAILFVPLILLISLNNGIITAVSNTRSFVFLGEISFGIYILQVPVFAWSAEVFKRLHLSYGATYFYTSLALLIIAASVSYVYIEAPLRERIKKMRITREGRPQIRWNPWHRYKL